MPAVAVEETSAAARSKTTRAQHRLFKRAAKRIVEDGIEIRYDGEPIAAIEFEDGLVLLRYAETDGSASHSCAAYGLDFGWDASVDETKKRLRAYRPVPL